MRTISEVADDLDLPQHVLRFWETRFNQIKPMKRGGGRRYYRREDIDLLRGIKALLYEEGYTIRGVQRMLKEQGVKVAIDFANGNESHQNDMIDYEELPSEIPSAAVSIADIKKTAGKSKGILGRFSGKREEFVEPQGAVSNQEDLKTLQATLEELLECKRLLDQTRQR